MRYLILFLLICAPRPAAAQGPEAGAPAPLEPAVERSTSAVSANNGSLILNITKNARDSRVGLDYSLRWSFRDLLTARPSLSTLVSGVKAITEWDITENTRVNYYGFRTNPWRLILARDKAPAAGTSGPSGSGGTIAQNGVVKHSAYRRRLRFSVSPLVDDIKLNFNEQLREALLRGSLRKASPAWEQAGKEGRKAFVHDVLSLGVWDAPLPGLEEGKEGLEYLGGEKRR